MKRLFYFLKEYKVVISFFLSLVISIVSIVLNRENEPAVFLGLLLLVCWVILFSYLILEKDDLYRVSLLELPATALVITAVSFLYKGDADIFSLLGAALLIGVAWILLMWGLGILYRKEKLLWIKPENEKQKASDNKFFTGFLIAFVMLVGFIISIVCLWVNFIKV